MERYRLQRTGKSGYLIGDIGAQDMSVVLTLR